MIRSSSYFSSYSWLLLSLLGVAVSCSTSTESPSSGHEKSIFGSWGKPWPNPQSIKACFSHEKLSVEEKQDTKTLAWAESTVRNIVEREINTYTRVNVIFLDHPCESDTAEEARLFITWDNKELPRADTFGIDRDGLGYTYFAYDFRNVVGLSNANPNSTGKNWLQENCTRSREATRNCLELVALHELQHLLFLGVHEQYRDSEQCKGYGESEEDSWIISTIDHLPLLPRYSIARFWNEPFDHESLMNLCYYHGIIESDRVLDANFQFWFSPGDIRQANGIYASQSKWKCGNGYCEPGERRHNCPQDCPR